MANEFRIKNGFFSEGSSNITGSLETSGSQVYLKTNGFIVENVDINGSLIEATTAGGVYIWSTNTNPSADFNNRYLYESTGVQVTADWNEAWLADPDTGFNSLRWKDRQLIKSDGTTITLDWETGAFTGSMEGTASFAATASFLIGGATVDTGSLVTTASFNSFTSSYTTGSFTGSFIGDGSGLTGIGATERRSDYTGSADPNINLLYLGYAAVGSLDAADVWTISQLSISSSGETVTRVTSSAAWTNRYSYTYI